MRTQDEILEKFEQIRKESMFGFGAQVLGNYLEFDSVKPFLKPEVKREEWATTANERDTIIQEMREYMEFAWGKAEDHRGLSAGRSIEKMEAWLWLLEDEMDLESIPYANYGAPKLKAICDKYGFPVPDSDEIANMIQGRPCEPGCDMGCRN